MHVENTKDNIYAFKAHLSENAFLLYNNHDVHVCVQTNLLKFQLISWCLYPARRQRGFHARLHERTVVNSTSGSYIHAIAVG